MTAGSAPEDRITRLEEAVGFTDHLAAQLSEQIAALNAEVARLSRRLTTLEQRLGELDERVGETPPVVPPPHAAGPDVPRDPL